MRSLCSDGITRAVYITLFVAGYEEVILGESAHGFAINLQSHEIPPDSYWLFHDLDQKIFALGWNKELSC